MCNARSVPMLWLAVMLGMVSAGCNKQGSPQVETSESTAAAPSPQNETPVADSNPHNLFLSEPLVLGFDVEITGAVDSKANAQRIVWNWGDGSREAESWFPAKHRYKKAGEYEVRVTSHDAAGRSSTSSVTVEVDPEFQKEQAVALIKQLGGKFEEDPNILGKPIVRLDLGNTKLNAKGLEHLKSLTSLEYLKLASNSLADDALPSIRHMTELKSLDMWHNPAITDQGLESLKNLTKIEGLVLAHANLTGSGFRHLEGMTNLKFLAIDGLPNLEDQNLKHLSPLANLEDIRLGGDRKVTDAGLQHLQPLSQLKVIYLNQTQVSDAGLAFLQGKELKSVSLDKTNIGDAGLALLGQMKSLQELRCDDTRVTDAGLAHLTNLSNLLNLHVERTEVTDEGLKSVGALSGLHHLSLRGTKVTDAGLQHLKGMKNLQNLAVGDTQITEEGMKHIKAALPKCSVHK